MMNALRITIFTLMMMTAGLLASNEAEALLPTHQCTFCHSLHGSSSTSSFVPLNSPTNIEVLCLGCHLTANGATDAVQPHRFASGDTTVDALYITCTDCHNVHDNMPNWRPGHTDADNPGGANGWTEGINAKMVGREDPDATTPYAIIITKEIDRDQDGLPDRDAAVPVTCDGTIVNDCYMTGKRHVIFENAEPALSGASIHAFADDNEDLVDDTTVIGVNANLSNAVGANASEWDSICQMCHMETGNHTGWVGGGGNNGHNSGKRCTDGCHRHDYCFDKGNDCSKWTVPNRDLQVDTVSAAPASVNGGDTVTITVDVTNQGDNVEDIEVRYSSSIEGTLGRSTAANVASLGSAQTSFDWVTVEGGIHTVTANIVPVIGELVIANNSGTDSVTVAGADVHDVSVTLVTAPSPILQGNTETVSVDIANPGTFTETFNVVLYDNTDDPGHASPIGTLSSGALAPSGTTTLNFSWNTTGASLGTHTLEAVADTVASETNTGNNSATTTSTVAIHDVAVTAVTAPASVDQGITATVDVDIANLSSSYSDTFNVTLYDDTDTVTIGTLSSGALAASGTTTLNFSWNTTGASIANHTLRAVAATVTSETITANNTASTTSDVIVPVTHDVAVTSVSAPATVDRGTSPTVTVRVTNNGGATETFNVTLSSDLDGQIQILSSGALAPSNFIDLNFTWVTDPTTSLGLRTLTAVADTVLSETNTGDNTGSTTSTVTSHDVAVNSVTAPASTVQGATAPVDVSVTNQGSFTETFNVTLASDLDGTIQTLSSGALGAGASTVLNFSWDTTGSTIATHTLTATAATVSGELDTSDNTASTTSDVTTPPVHDVAVDSVTAPASTAQGSIAAVDVNVSNPGGFTETFNVTLYDNTDDPGHASPIQTLSSGALAPLTGTATLNFSWDTTGASIATHTLEAVATHNGGDGGTDANSGNNSASTTADVASAGPINDVAILSVTANPNPVAKTSGSGTIVTLTIIVENQGTVAESIDVTLNSNQQVNDVCTFNGVALSAGATSTTEFVCTWKVKSAQNAGTHLMTATATAVPGETDLADNTGTTTLVIN